MYQLIHSVYLNFLSYMSWYWLLRMFWKSGVKCKYIKANSSLVFGIILVWISNWTHIYHQINCKSTFILALLRGLWPCTPFMSLPLGILGIYNFTSFLSSNKSTQRAQTSIIYLGFYVAFNTVQVISRQVVGRAEETSTYSSSGFCTVNCRPTASNYQLSHLRPFRELNPGLRGGRRECYHSATVAPDLHQGT